MKIEVKNLNKKLKNIDVIKNVNVVFKSGKIYGITGRNGSGKSVFLIIQKKILFQKTLEH